jgi:hypothetical protein
MGDNVGEEEEDGEELFGDNLEQWDIYPCECTEAGSALTRACVEIYILMQII